MKVNQDRVKVTPYLLGIAITLSLVFSLIGFASPVIAANPIAVVDYYTVDMNLVLTTPAPGVLKNDTDADEDILTAAVVNPPSHGILVLNTDGSFTYTPTIGYFGDDTFVYQACDGTACSNATVTIVVTASEIYACTIDQDGSNDESEQADLNEMCTDVSPDNPTSVGVTWSWDSLYGSGANSYYACALFDTDGDGNINTAVCIQMFPDPDNLNIMTFSKAEYYTCSDAKADRCTIPGDPIPVEYCSTYSDDTDPFNPTDYPLTAGSPGGSGSDFPSDMIGDCTIPVTALPDNATLQNVCSFTSVANPNSNPTDCIAPTTTDVGAFLTIIKDTIPDVENVSFDFSVTNGVDTPWNRTVTTGASGTGASDRFLVPAGTYSVEELMATMPGGWELTDAYCYNRSDPTVELGTGINPIESIPVASYDDIYCYFTNRANADISVVKSDGDYGTYPYPSVTNPFYEYTVTVTNNGDATAYNVQMIDTLDAYTSFDSTTEAIQVDGVDVDSSICLYTDDGVGTPGGGTVTCNLGDMLSNTTKIITFWVKIEPGVETLGLLEVGPGCSNDVTTADICNGVNVTTTSNDTNIDNDLYFEPKDVGLPTSVSLTTFDVTDIARKSITLGWETTTETNNAGFNIYRAKTEDGSKVKLNDVLIISNTYPGSPIGAVYTFVDETVRPRKTYYYWLEAVDLNGSSVFYGPVSATALVPKK